MALHQPKSVKKRLAIPLALLWEPVAHLILILPDHPRICGRRPKPEQLSECLKMQGNFYNDAVIDPYMLEALKSCVARFPCCMGKAAQAAVEHGQQAPDH